jgi:hypothetical protein
MGKLGRMDGGSIFSMNFKVDVLAFKTRSRTALRARTLGADPIRVTELFEMSNRMSRYLPGRTDNWSVTINK